MKRLFLVIITIAFFFSCSNSETHELDIDPGKYFEIEKEWVLGDSLLNTEDKNESEEPINFGRISSLAISDDKKVYILDSDLKQIVIFDSLGNYKRKIFGGYGRGPGEFELPLSIDIDQDGVLSVYDYNSRRLSFFREEDGEFLTSKTISVPSKFVINLKDKIIAAILAARNHAVAVFPKPEGEIEYLLELSERDLEFSGDGAVYVLGRYSNNEVLIAAQTPGVWYLMNEEGIQKHGEELLPNRKARSYRNLGIIANPAYTIGIGKLPNNNIAIAWYELTFFEDEAPEISSYYIDIFSEKGDHKDRIKLPFKWIQAINFDKDSGVYIAVNEPYIRVLKYRIKEI